jgi:hypothetical protein
MQINLSQIVADRRGTGDAPAPLRAHLAPKIREMHSRQLRPCEHELLLLTQGGGREAAQLRPCEHELHSRIARYTQDS